ncbi:FecR family protein [Chitinophaga sp. Cy-1792]|uniref:FecR family protein n=1 Tax=Chitinophaga sp. Cy-1792 TaxID=2608339 RepID=UPI00141D7857|nr:FecR family protein [Chitinophaga sp. Cy-1792]NIG53584.1 DUF4974 domain-containing protein [Chitinophaga sp. Cy-1792]
MNQPENKNDLFNRLLNGACKPEELPLLIEWLGSGEMDPEAARMVQSCLESMPVPEAVDTQVREQLAALLPDILRETPVVPMPARRYSIRWVAAAVAISFVAGSLLLLHHGKHTVSLADVKPGSDKATLIMADGAVVTLDSSAKTIRQGSQLIRQTAGELQYNSGNNGKGQNLLQTPRGGRFKLLLPDGSKVWLNAASSLRYPVAFNEKERVVKLEGEAYFEPTADAAHPFIVQCGNERIEVLGTAFNIMAYADEPVRKVTLVTGAVKVVTPAAQEVLKPSMQAVLSGGDIQVKQVDIHSATGWKDGFIVMQNASVPEIMRQIARWYNVDVRMKNDRKEAHLSGDIPMSLSLKEVLEILEMSGIDTEYSEQTVIVK